MHSELGVRRTRTRARSRSQSQGRTRTAALASAESVVNDGKLASPRLVEAARSGGSSGATESASATPPGSPSIAGGGSSSAGSTDLVSSLIMRFVSKPRTITFLLLGLTLILYLAFFYPPAGLHEAMRRGLGALCFIFLVYCSIQLKDTLLVRPHPAVWRVITGCGLLYLMALTFLLQLRVEDARDVVHIFFPDAGRPLPERSYASQCALYNSTTGTWDFSQLKASLFDEFIVAHLLGWYFSALMIRDGRLCFILSIAFELVEISFQHWMENFRECWWDHVILDLLVCNTLGILAGLWTSRFLEFRQYNWMGAQAKNKKRMGPVRLLLSQFLPVSWTRYKWEMFSSINRLLLCAAALLMYLWIKTNSFFVKYVLYIPPRSPFNTFRLILMWATSLPGVREYYEYITNPECTRLGPNSWLSLAIVITELLLTIKFSVESTGGRSLFRKPFPPAVVLSWAAFVLMFGAWAVGHFAIRRIPKADRTPLQRTIKRRLRVLRYLSFVPLLYMFVAECPDLQWGRHYAERLGAWLGLPTAA